MKKSLLILLLVFVPLLSSIYYLVSIVGAQGDEFSLGIYPPILEINTEPPANIEANIHLQNLSELLVSLETIYKPFKMAENGDGKLEYTNEDLTLIFQKIVLQNSLSLEPFESRDLNLRINLEANTPVRDYYFSVIFISKSPEPQEEASAALISGGIGTNVILSVGKKSPSSGEIKEFSTPPIIGVGPVPITLLLRNKSSHYVVPTGRITIKDMLGREAGQINILPQHILANSSRFMIDSNQASPSAELAKQVANLSGEHAVLIWPKKFLFGRYTLQAHIKLSETGPIFESKIYFFAIPIYLVFFVSFSSFVLLGIYLRIRKRV